MGGENYNSSPPSPRVKTAVFSFLRFYANFCLMLLQRGNVAKLGCSRLKNITPGWYQTSDHVHQIVKLELLTNTMCNSIGLVAINAAKVQLYHSTMLWHRSLFGLYISSYSLIWSLHPASSLLLPQYGSSTSKRVPKAWSQISHYYQHCVSAILPALYIGVWQVFRTRVTNWLEVLTKNPRTLSSPKAEIFFVWGGLLEGVSDDFLGMKGVGCIQIFCVWGGVWREFQMIFWGWKVWGVFRTRGTNGLEVLA